MSIPKRLQKPSLAGHSRQRSAQSLVGLSFAAWTLIGVGSALGQLFASDRVSINASDADPDACELKFLPEAKGDANARASTSRLTRLAEKTITKPSIVAPAPIVVRTLVHARQTDDAHELGLKTITAEAARFKGIQPGSSTLSELRSAWGTAKASTKIDGGARETYHFDRFERLIVTVQADRVAGIAIFLISPIANDELAKQLELESISPTIVRDEAGRSIGKAFPERGVLFVYAPSDTSVTQQLVLEPIDPQAFLLRAQARLTSLPAHAVVDADFAAELNPQSAEAQSLRAQALSALGKRTAALQAAESAMRLAPEVKEHRLLAARLMLDLGDDQGALRLLTEVVARQPSALVAARAHELSGDCLSSVANPNYAAAFEQHQRAIRLAEPLAASANAATRRTANEILVDAHLGIARDVAYGEWQNKGRAVARWLLRGKSLADEMVAKHDADDELLFRVHETALAVAPVTDEEFATGPWIDGVRQIGERRVDAAVEPGYRAQLRWRMGVALADAVVVEESRQRIGEALALADLAERLLTETASQVEAPDRDLRVGRLYYRRGAIEAIQRQNHRAAVAWYDKSLPLLQASLPAPGSSEAARHGDLYVSMAVSYWETGDRSHAVKLTKEGAGLIEQAADAAHVNRRLLVVPYGNLSSMLTEQGDATSGKHYAELASRCEAHRVK
jgi:tetratricopeptide (TPR) repeat protein